MYLHLYIYICVCVCVCVCVPCLCVCVYVWRGSEWGRQTAFVLARGDRIRNRCVHPSHASYEVESASERLSSGIMVRHLSCKTSFYLATCPATTLSVHQNLILHIGFVLQCVHVSIGEGFLERNRFIIFTTETVYILEPGSCHIQCLVEGVADCPVPALSHANVVLIVLKLRYVETMQASKRNIFPTS